MVIFFSVILFFYPLSVFISNRQPITNFYMHLAEVIQVPLFWLSLPPAVFLMTVPFYFERIYW